MADALLVPSREKTAEDPLHALPSTSTHYPSADNRETNRAKVVAPPQPTLARNLGHSPRECSTAQCQIWLNASFFLYGEFKNFQQPPNSLDALNDS